MHLDHVAMVLRFDTNEAVNVNQHEIYYIEATSNRGVSVTRWSDCRTHLGQFYERIVLRHLDFERNETSLLQLEKFLKEVNGHKYAFKPSALLSNRNTVKPVGFNTTDNVDKERGFFCSELVAKAYKVCGIMTPTNLSC